MDLSQTILVIDVQTLLAFFAGALFCRICRSRGPAHNQEPERGRPLTPPPPKPKQ